MGNSSSSGRGHHEDTVDFGYLSPQGVYTGPRDWNQTVVAQLICERKLAPFYRPLEDYEDSWDDEQVLAARKELPESDSNQGDASMVRAESISSSSSRTHHKRPSATKEVARQSEAALYRGAIECPICFLYYPFNINHSRCCDQAICTECFVQIKRADPTTTHLVSEPASCPYCVQENFGIVYTPPSWRAGIGSEGATPPSWPDPPRQPVSPNVAMKRRRRSFGPDSPEVVTIDQIRPDWEAKLAAVRAAVTRRANRRIIMRQVGDRLIPVGVTSGRVHALPTGEDGQQQGENGEGGADRGSRRTRRRNQNQDLNQFFGSMGLGGQDLEELMIMEAMRLSLVEHEEQQRRDREAKSKEPVASDMTAAQSGATAASSSSAAAPDASSVATENTDSSTSTLTSPALGGGSAPQSPETLEHATTNGGTQRPSRSRNSHGQSLSIDISSTDDASSGIWKRRSSASPYRVSAALRSAASTASALVSPSSEDGPSTSGRNSDEAPPSVGPSNTATPMAANVPLPPDTVPSDGAPSSSGDVADSSGSNPIAIQKDFLTMPPMQHSDSFASSIDFDNIIPSYDPLPSAPGSAASSFSHKPLLASPNIPDALSPSDSGNSSQVLSSSQVL